MSRPYVLTLTQQDTYRQWLAALLQENYAFGCTSPDAPVAPPCPDVLLLPWHQSCLAQLASLRQQFDSVPVLVLARRPSASEVAAAFRAGASDVLIQPDGAAIHEAIERLLSNGPPHWKGWRRWLDRSWDRLKQRTVASMDASFCLLPNPFTTAAPEASLAEATAPSVAPPHLAVHLLGHARMTLDGQVVPSIKSQKGIGVLAYLLYHHPKPVPREVLMERFWADVLPESARNSLNVAWYSVRKAFQQLDPTLDPVVFEQGSYHLHPDWTYAVDVQTFLQQWHLGRSLAHQQGLAAAAEAYQRMVDQYRGDFIEQFPYLEWVSGERENLREIYLSALERLCQYQCQQGQYGAACLLGQELLRQDACREGIHRYVMLAHYRLRQRNRALKQYEACCATLQAELGVSPAPLTQQLAEAMRQHTLNQKLIDALFDPQR